MPSPTIFWTLSIFTFRKAWQILSDKTSFIESDDQSEDSINLESTGTITKGHFAIVVDKTIFIQHFEGTGEI